MYESHCHPAGVEGPRPGPGRLPPGGGWCGVVRSRAARILCSVPARSSVVLLPGRRSTAVRPGSALGTLAVAALRSVGRGKAEGKSRETFPATFPPSSSGNRWVVFPSLSEPTVGSSSARGKTQGDKRRGDSRGETFTLAFPPVGERAGETFLATFTRPVGESESRGSVSGPRRVRGPAPGRGYP